MRRDFYNNEARDLARVIEAETKTPAKAKLN